MLKSCQYCGKIHDKKYICREKEQAMRKRQRKRYNEKESFRGTETWKNKREEIRKRDCQVCQVCIRGLFDPDRMFETDDLSVHHAVSVEEDYEKRLDDDNLITLCGKHHEMAESGEIPLELIKEIIYEQEQKRNTLPPGCLVQIF